ncbi:ATPase [Alphaproteobacteria bacterium]|nr:ATPase [Alphaproteobacteria bacterium]
MFIKREIADFIEEIRKQFPVILITGPRQVGKTTVLREDFPDYNYVSLDDSEARNLAQRDPMLFLKTYRHPLIIDEVQYAPELFVGIKMIVDEKRENGLFLLTGSQKFRLMRGVSESMAGRVAILDMLGLSNAEILGRKCQIFDPESIDFSYKDPANVGEIYAKIWKGSFPAFYKDVGSNWSVFFRSYVSTYLERDIRDLMRVSDERTFLLFLTFLASRTGQLLNMAEVAREVGIDNKTAKSWLSIVETTGLVHLLYPYYRNVTKRLIKTPKLYFLDTGLACYLAKINSPEILEASYLSGAMFETYVFCELLKSFWNRGRDAPFYFYRDRDMKEIDLLMEQNGVLYPIEIKKTAMPSRTATKNFSVLEKIGVKVGHGVVICLVNSPIPISETVIAIPVGAIGC